MIKDRLEALLHERTKHINVWKVPVFICMSFQLLVA